MADKVIFVCAACGDRSCRFTTDKAIPKGVPPPGVCPFSVDLVCEWTARKTLKDVADNG